MAETSVTESYNALLTTTLRHLEREVRDEITRGNKFVAWLKEHGRMDTVAGGERIQIPLMYQLNTGADIFDGYGLLNVEPQDGITSAFFPWSQMAVPITISGKERRQNMSREAAISLLSSKVKQSMNSAKSLQNECIVAGKLSSGATGSINQFVARTGSTDNSASGPLPLSALIDADADRSVSIGEINGANESWWRNQVKASSASTYVGYKQEKLDLYNTVSRGVMGPPDLIISDQLVWQLYWASLQSQERYFMTDPKIVNVLGGSRALAFIDAAHIWDEIVPDVGTSTATPEFSNGDAAIGTYLQSGSHGTEFHINTEAMSWVTHPQANWTQTPFMTPVNQDASTAHLLWQGQTTVNNRRKTGVMYDIDNSIAS